MTVSTGKPPVSDELPRVLVIGAGPAGIVTGYFLQRAGIGYQIIDRSPVIASTWASLYPSLRLNTTRYFSHLPGRRFPLRWGVFPTGRQYHSYVTAFAEEHGLNIALGVEVTRVKPESGGWQVETSAGTRWHPIVVLATGRFNHPFTAGIPGLDRFRGTLMHACDFRGPAPLAGKRVMVIGNGPSGLDIALDVGRQNAPRQPVLLSMRSGISLRRRYPLGLTKHAWVILTRALPERLRVPFLDFVEKLGFPKTAQRGIKIAAPGVSSGAVAVRGPELIHAVRRGEVSCVDGPERVNETSVTTTSGDTYEIDALILATGYRPALGYLEGISYDCDEQGWPRRYNSRPYSMDYARLIYRGTYDAGAAIDRQFEPRLREIRGYPGLFQVGLYYKGKGAMYNFNVEAEIAAAQIAQLLT